VAANVASPNLNPTPLTDLLQFFAMFLLGAALTNMFGRSISSGSPAPTWRAKKSYDSLMPLLGAGRDAQHAAREIIFGGAGSGLYGMILLVMLTIFIRRPDDRSHPEYLGQEDRPA